MAFKKNTEFKYSIRGINRVVEERGNQYIRFAEVAWGAGEDESVEPNQTKYDLRKFISTPTGEEKMLKGVSFLTKDGPTSFLYILLEEGFGEINKIMSIVSNRKDFSKYTKQATSSKQNSKNICDLNQLL